MANVKTKTEILEALASIPAEDWVREDIVYLNDLDSDAVKYEHCEGYYYSDNHNQYWIADPNDFEVDDDGYISMPNAVWLKNK